MLPKRLAEEIHEAGLLTPNRQQYLIPKSWGTPPPNPQLAPEPMNGIALAKTRPGAATSRRRAERASATPTSVREIGQVRGKENPTVMPVVVQSIAKPSQIVHSILMRFGTSPERKRLQGSRICAVCPRQPCSRPPCPRWRTLSA